MQLFVMEMVYTSSSFGLRFNLVVVLILLCDQKHQLIGALVYRKCVHLLCGNVAAENCHLKQSLKLAKP